MSRINVHFRISLPFLFQFRQHSSSFSFSSGEETKQNMYFTWMIWDDMISPPQLYTVISTAPHPQPSPRRHRHKSSHSHQINATLYCFYGTEWRSARMAKEKWMLWQPTPRRWDVPCCVVLPPSIISPHNFILIAHIRVFIEKRNKLNFDVKKTSGVIPQRMFTRVRVGRTENGIGWYNSVHNTRLTVWGSYYFSWGNCYCV